jgi:hypothetical protein
MTVAARISFAVLRHVYQSYLLSGEADCYRPVAVGCSIKVGVATRRSVNVVCEESAEKQTKAEEFAYDIGT